MVNLSEFRDPAPRLLVIDIETMAARAWVWGTWNQNIAPNQIISHKRVISFAAKWVGDKKIRFYSEHHDGAEAMRHAAWKLLDEADAVIGYNSDRFDIRHLNTEFKLVGLEPPSHYQRIDLYKISKREFAFSSNRLDAIADRLWGGSKKKHQGFTLWPACDAGDEKAWKQMRSYNRHDVALTERLFEEYRPWIALRGTQSQKRLREVLG